MNEKFVNISNDSDRISLIKTVTEATSNQAKVTNRLWLAVITNTIFIYLPVTPGKNGEESFVYLPFNLPAIPPMYFYPIAFAMLSVLALGLAVAHAQQMRGDRIAHYIIDEFNSGSAGTTEKVRLNLRDLFDILRHPCLTRVAPLPQLITGHYHTQLGRDNRKRKGTQPSGWLFTVSYLLLKLFALIVLFVIPMFGLVIAFLRVAESLGGWLLFILGATGLVALISLLTVTIADSVSVLRLPNKLSKKTD